MKQYLIGVLAFAISAAIALNATEYHTNEWLAPILVGVAIWTIVYACLVIVLALFVTLLGLRSK